MEACIFSAPNFAELLNSVRIQSWIPPLLPGAPLGTPYSSAPTVQPNPAPALAPVTAPAPAAPPSRTSIVNPTLIPEIQAAMAGQNFQLRVLLRNGVRAPTANNGDDICMSFHSMNHCFSDCHRRSTNCPLVGGERTNLCSFIQEHVMTLDLGRSWMGGLPAEWTVFSTPAICHPRSPSIAPYQALDSWAEWCCHPARQSSFSSCLHWVPARRNGRYETKRNVHCPSLWITPRFASTPHFTAWLCTPKRKTPKNVQWLYSDMRATRSHAMGSSLASPPMVWFHSRSATWTSTTVQDQLVRHILSAAPHPKRCTETCCSIS